MFFQPSHPTTTDCKHEHSHHTFYQGLLFFTSPGKVDPPVLRTSASFHTFRHLGSAHVKNVSQEGGLQLAMTQNHGKFLYDCCEGINSEKNVAPKTCSSKIDYKDL